MEGNAGDVFHLQWDQPHYLNPQHTAPAGSVSPRLLRWVWLLIQHCITKGKVSHTAWVSNALPVLWTSTKQRHRKHAACPLSGGIPLVSLFSLAKPFCSPPTHHPGPGFAWHPSAPAAVCQSLEGLETFSDQYLETLLFNTWGCLHTLSQSFNPKCLLKPLLFPVSWLGYWKTEAGDHVRVPVPLNPLTTAKWLIILASLWHHC